MLITIGYTGLRFGEAIGLERGYLHPGEIHVEWQLHELNGWFHRLPPKDDSYRSPRFEPQLPVDLPPFLDRLLAHQFRASPGGQCACAAQHGGTGRYVFLSPDGGHYRRSNYGRRVFRPACDGRYEPGTGRPTRLIIADATTWPGTPLAAWPAAQPGTTAAFSPPCGRGIQAIPDGTPLACWLPIQPGLTPHGLRHSHKTWMEGRGIASNATFPGRREDGAIRNIGPRSLTTTHGGWGEPAGQHGRLRTGLQQMQRCCSYLCCIE
jgi:integrase